MITLSVIIPVYNVANYLEECLASILSLDTENLEVICINDASTDTSGEILERYVLSDPRVKVLNHEKNAGLSEARNTGIKAATGRYIYFVDSDDYLTEGSISYLMDEAASLSTDVSYYQYLCFSDSSRDIIDDEQVGRFADITAEMSGTDFFTEQLLHKKMRVMAWQALYRTEFLRENCIWFPKGLRHEDYLFTFDCLMSAKQVSAKEHVVYAYRKRLDSITGDVNEHTMKSLAESLMQVVHYFSQNDMNETLRCAVEKYAKTIFYSYIDKRRLYWNKDITWEDLRHGNDTDCNVLETMLHSGMTMSRYANFTITEKKRICDAERICIYGAGKVGRSILEYLRNMKYPEHQIVFAKTMVSCADENIDGIAVKNITDAEVLKPGTLVIVSVIPKNQNTMVEILCELGWKDFVCAR